MQFDDLLLHPYINKIDEMCMADEPVTKIVNWVKNTVDSDPSIPEDKRKDYYVTVSKISAYKKELRESAKNVVVPEISNIVVSSSSEAKKIQVEPIVDNVRKSIIEKHAEKNMIDIYKTLVNLATRLEEQINIIGSSIQNNIDIDPELHKAYRGYFNSFITLLKELSEITGYKDFYKKMGENFGDAVSKEVLDKKKKDELKSFIYQLLTEVGDSDKIPIYIEKIDKILGGSSD